MMNHLNEMDLNISTAFVEVSAISDVGTVGRRPFAFQLELPHKTCSAL